MVSNASLLKRRFVKSTAAVMIAAMTLTGCSVAVDSKSGQTGSEQSETEQTGLPKTEMKNDTDKDIQKESETQPHSAKEANQTASISEVSDIPDAEWQKDVSFPDWQGSVNSNYAVNDRIAFYGYEDQGKLYIEPGEGVSDFSLYINDRKVDTSAVETGKKYLIDFSKVAINGHNSLQISGISEGEVRVMIPYPTVIDGTPEEVGIRQESLDLIDGIISADIANGFSSAQLAVVKDGKLVCDKSWGNVRTWDEEGEPVDSKPVTSDTLYDLASNTKMYSVNYAIQYLLTNGEVDLDSTICEILGDGFSEDTIDIAYEGYDHVSLETNKEWKKALTIRDLMRHQGGFPPGPHYYNDRYDNATQDYNSDNGNILYVGTGADEASREETLKMLFKTPLMYEPGSQTVYSDVDYMVLCYCVEKITGKSMDEYLSEVFWEPMGLTHITYNPLRNGFEPEDCAATELMGNSRDGQLHYSGIRTATIQGEVHDPNAYYCMNGVSGHAGMFANASDLARLASVMLTGGYGENRYFSDEVIDLFTAPKSEKYPTWGLGWWRMAGTRNGYFGSTAASDVFGHQGFTGTLTMIDPDHNLVVVLLTNKIHSRILEGDRTLSKYKGNFYTTASLGFVSQILRIGMEGAEVDETVWSDLASDMADDAYRVIQDEGITDHDHPRWKAYDALLHVKDNM